MDKLPKKRIEVIDALRGFALLAICLLHSMEHFECYYFPEASSGTLKWLDDICHPTVRFLFAGKSYAIFSLLFGLSFFIQMDNQEQKGGDFRLRFAWRMVILYVFGFLNAWLYYGEIFETYAVLGLFIIPLWKLPNKWLIPVCLIFLLQIPNLISFLIMLAFPSVEAYPFSVLNDLLASGRFGNSTEVFLNGSLSDVLSYNFWSQGRMLKWSWMFGSSRVVHILGLFMAGLLIGRFAIHRSEEKMVKYSKRIVIIGLISFPVFYCLHGVLPFLITDHSKAVEVGQMTFRYYYELGQMFMLIGLFVLIYFRIGWQKTLNKLAPVGRMSVTNYMMQTVIGTTLFYGFGFGLARITGSFYAGLIGITFCCFQLMASNWWMGRFYYGPMEWLWRCATWLDFKNIPFRRK